MWLSWNIGTLKLALRIVEEATLDRTCLEFWVISCKWNEGMLTWSRNAWNGGSGREPSVRVRNCQGQCQHEIITICWQLHEWSLKISIAFLVLLELQAGSTRLLWEKSKVFHFLRVGRIGYLVIYFFHLRRCSMDELCLTFNQKTCST